MGYRKENAIIKRFFAAIREINSAGEIYVKAVKIHGGVFTSGEPDVIGCVNGKSFAIEFKSPDATSNKNGTDRQIESLASWADAGAFVGIAKNLKGALEIAGVWGRWCKHTTEGKIRNALKEHEKSVTPIREKRRKEEDFGLMGDETLD